MGFRLVERVRVGGVRLAFYRDRNREVRLTQRGGRFTANLGYYKASGYRVEMAEIVYRYGEDAVARVLDFHERAKGVALCSGRSR